MEGSTIRRCGLVDLGEALLEKVFYCQCSLWSSYAQALPSAEESLLVQKTVFSWLPKEQDIELVPSPALCLHEHCHASHCDKELSF